MEEFWRTKSLRSWYDEPCSRENTISYETWCFLGALRNPKLGKMEHQHGSLKWTTYHLKRY